MFEQQRRQLVIADAVDAAMLIKYHEVRIDLGNLLGNKSILQRAARTRRRLLG
jgi:hypothetical protein